VHAAGGSGHHVSARFRAWVRAVSDPISTQVRGSRGASAKHSSSTSIRRRGFVSSWQIPERHTASPSNCRTRRHSSSTSQTIGRQNPACPDHPPSSLQVAASETTRVAMSHAAKGTQPSGHTTGCDSAGTSRYGATQSSPTECAWTPQPMESSIQQSSRGPPPSIAVESLSPVTSEASNGTSSDVWLLEHPANPSAHASSRRRELRASGPSEGIRVNLTWLGRRLHGPLMAE
jgi:hypothetical protein